MQLTLAKLAGHLRRRIIQPHQPAPFMNVVKPDKVIQPNANKLPAAYALLSRLGLRDVLTPQEVLSMLDSTSNETGQEVLHSKIFVRFYKQYPNMPKELITQGVTTLANDETLIDVARWCGFQQLVGLSDMKILPQLALKLLNKLNDISSDKADAFVNQHFLTRAINWEQVMSTYCKKPELEVNRMCKSLYKCSAETRMLSESGRQSPNPIFVVGVFAGSLKVGEAFGQSLSLARKRAQMDALLKHYLKPIKVARVKLYETPMQIQTKKKSVVGTSA